MRHPTDDFRYDPYAETQFAKVPERSANSPMMANKDHYLKTKTALFGHKFCTQHCFDLSQAKTSQEESSCLSSCVSQYSSSMKMLMSQQVQFENMLKDLKLNGRDIFEARDI